MTTWSRGGLLKLLLGCALLVACAGTPLPAQCQTDAGGAMSAEDAKLLERLVWESPWEGRVTSPSGHSFTYRAKFVDRKGASPIADVTALYNNSRGSSALRVKDGVVRFSHPTGAEITVRPDQNGQLVGTAESAGVTLNIVYKPLP